MNESIAFSGMFEHISVDNEFLSFDNFFKAWLLECGTECVQLFLNLPAVGGKELTLKCDLLDVIINPLSISGGSQMMVQTSLNRLGNASSLVGSRSVSSPAPVYRMLAKELVCVDSICESVLYGLPVVIKATSCWKLDWEDLDHNQQVFAALCELLQRKNIALLVEEEQKRGSKVQGLYCLIPSPSQTMLLKSIAVRDVMMPSPFHTSTSWKECVESVSLVESSLDALKVESSFNPLRYTTYLTDNLVAAITKSSGAPKVAPTQKKGQPMKHQTASSAASSAPRARVTPVFSSRGKKSASALLYTSTTS